MQDHRSKGRDCERPHIDVRKEATTAEQDTAIESAVIALMLSRHPSQLTLEELSRELVSDADDFRQLDAIHRAVAALGGVGLLNRNGSFLVPSQAALRLACLLDF